MIFAEDIEVVAVDEVITEQLESQFPFREVAELNRVPEIEAVEVRIGSVDL